MNDTPSRLAEKLEAEGAKTLEIFRALLPDQWELTVYTDGSAWTIRQLLAHFVTAEVGILRLIDNIIEGGTGSPENFDISRFNEKEVSAVGDEHPNSLMRQYEQTRRVTIEKVRNLQDEDLVRVGRHPFLGPAPVVDIIKLIYRHNQIHQRDFRKLLV
jgi:DinB superfamily